MNLMTKVLISPSSTIMALTAIDNLLCNGHEVFATDIDGSAPGCALVSDFKLVPGFHDAHFLKEVLDYSLEKEGSV